jgi:lanthanide-dependent methanol dehydrogenase
MKHLQRSFLLTAAMALCTFASASDIEQAMGDSKNWASQAGDYANHRYSTLNQINASNVGQLQVAWTMSTGVLRGHEGSPLVIGDTMYIHTPFPNNVYAVNLFQVEVRAQAGCTGRAGHVLRHGKPRPRL